MYIYANKVKEKMALKGTERVIFGDFLGIYIFYNNIALFKTF